jgi:hypothetical protein
MLFTFALFRPFPPTVIQAVPMAICLLFYGSECLPLVEWSLAIHNAGEALSRRAFPHQAAFDAHEGAHALSGKGFRTRRRGQQQADEDRVGLRSFVPRENAQGRRRKSTTQRVTMDRSKSSLARATNYKQAAVGGRYEGAAFSLSFSLSSRASLPQAAVAFVRRREWRGLPQETGSHTVHFFLEPVNFMFHLV